MFGWDLGRRLSVGESLPTTAHHLWAAELQAQKYLLNELCSCLIQLFFLLLFLSLSRDNLQKGKQLLSNKTQMYFTKEQWVGFWEEIFLRSLIQPTCSTTNCKIFNYWLVPRTVMVPGPLRCRNNQEQGDTEQEYRRMKFFGEEKEKISTVKSLLQHFGSIYQSLKIQSCLKACCD